MNGERGFTLLEVMVATAILGVGLTAVVTGVAMAVRSVALAVGYEQARLLGETQLALFLAERPVRSAQRTGNEGNMSWRVSGEAEPGQEGLLRIAAEVRFYAPGGDRVLTLETWEAERDLPKTISLEGGD